MTSRRPPPSLAGLRQSYQRVTGCHASRQRDWRLGGVREGRRKRRRRKLLDLNPSPESLSSGGWIRLLRKGKRWRSGENSTTNCR